VPKIADFGMAKKLDEQGHTKSGTVMGTPSYMAPEQAEGKTKQTGPATDIYALGAILYECLTGRPPFRGETALDTIMAVLSEPVPAMAQTIPPALNAICQRCLRKKPDERYPTALALADDLRRYLGGQRVAAFGMPKEREKRSEKRGFPRGLVAVLAVLAVAAGVAFWVSRGDNEPEGDGEHRPGKNFEPAFRLPDAAGEFLRFESASPFASVAFSPDGRHLAGLSGRLIRVWDLEQRAVIRELKGEDAPAGSLAFSRDGERILAGGGGTAVMWKVSGATELWRCGAPAEGRRLQQVCWLGDERGFLARPASGTIEHRDAESGKLIRALTFAGRRPEPHDIAVRPRSDQIAVALTGESGTGELVLGDVAADRRIRSFTPPALPGGEAHSPVRCAFSADGTLLLSGDKTGKVRLWKAETGELLHTFDGHQRARKPSSPVSHCTRSCRG
jgi:hypothetical protein